MKKLEKISFADTKENIISNLKKHINEIIGVINVEDKRKKIRKGKLLLVTDNTATFEFMLGDTHKELVSYLLSDFWRGVIRLEGVTFEALTNEEK